MGEGGEECSGEGGETLEEKWEVDGMKVKGRESVEAENGRGEGEHMRKRKRW